MRVAWLPAAAAIWVGGYLVGYLSVIASQGGSPATWYVAVLVAAIVVLTLTMLTTRTRPVLLSVATVLLAAACLVALLSIGIYLLPAMVATIAALSRSRPTTSPALGDLSGPLR